MFPMRRLLFAALMAFGIQNSANAATVSWNGPLDFLSAQMTFSSFVSDQLTSITFGAGGASSIGPYSHLGSSSPAVDLYIDLFNGSSWVNVYTTTIPALDLNNVLWTTVTPINFAAMAVSGIWFHSSNDAHFHNFISPGACDGNPGCFTNFNFNEVASPVPLPAALPLFATVLAGGGLIAWRRKRKAAKLVAQ